LAKAVAFPQPGLAASSACIERGSRRMSAARKCRDNKLDERDRGDYRQGSEACPIRIAIDGGLIGGRAESQGAAHSPAHRSQGSSKLGLSNGVGKKGETGPCCRPRVARQREAAAARLATCGISSSTPKCELKALEHRGLARQAGHAVAAGADVATNDRRRKPLPLPPCETAAP
jgi:hypothetical protein